MTLDEMCELERGLKELRDDVAAVEDDGTKPQFCANTIWIRKFKPRLVKLVGVSAQIDELRTIAAYDLAYRTLYQMLPACRNCLCI
jgi:hypothetical protein